MVICGKWVGVKEEETSTKEAADIKSEFLYVPLEVFGLGDSENWIHCMYINVNKGNWECRSMERRGFVCSINYISGMCPWGCGFLNRRRSQTG